MWDGKINNYSGKSTIIQEDEACCTSEVFGMTRCGFVHCLEMFYLQILHLPSVLLNARPRALCDKGTARRNSCPSVVHG